MFEVLARSSIRECGIKYPLVIIMNRINGSGDRAKCDTTNAG